MRWFSSYLSERKQFVLFKNKQSEQSEITLGVPQCSILGQLFFIVFMNDYADDSIISACSKNIQEIELKLNNDLQEISNWCGENRMVINVEKIKVKIVTTWKKRQHLDKTDINIYIKGDKLQVDESERLLGLQVDNVLIWKAQYKRHTTQLRGNLHFSAG